MKRVTKVLYYLFGSEASRLVLIYFVFSLVLVGMQDLILVFPPSACNLVRFSSAVLITIFRSLTDGYCFYGAISVRLARNNLLINLLILRILTSLELFLDHEFCCRLPGLTDACNNGEAELGENFFADYGTVRIA